MTKTLEDMWTVAWALRYWIIGMLVFLVAFCAAEKVFEPEEIKAPEIDPYRAAREQYRRYTL